MVKLFTFVLAAIAIVLPAAVSAREYETVDYDFNFDEDSADPRSLIMMVPDGTGPNVFTLARAVLDPTLKTRLHVDNLLMGQVQTYSADSYVTDSASSATAYSTGFKTYNAAIGVDMYKQPLGTILEAAKARGMITGMVVTSRVTHATPASFGSHVTDRDDEATIAQQYVNNKNLDFLLGGGAKFFKDDMYADLSANGYTLVKNYAELMNYHKENVDSGKLRIFGLFKDSHMSYEVDRVRKQQADGGQQSGGEREPSLPEMVDTILSILKNNPVAKKNGFFMLIEGSRVDHAGHANDAGTMAREAIAFDEAVGIVKDYVSSNNNVGLVSAADHGTGGMTLGRDGIYEWDPKALAMQTMSTEGMEEELEEVADKECGDAKAKDSCVSALMAKSTELLKAHTNVTAPADEDLAELKKSIEEAAQSGSLSDVVIELGHAISAPALVGWTTLGHVGTDVDLHCMGPLLLERLCKGLHQNTHLNKIMTTYLNLGHYQEVETLRLRNFTTIEHSPEIDM